MMNVATIAPCTPVLALALNVPFWGAAAIAVAVHLVAIAAVVFFMRRTKIGAIARLTWSQAWRMKVVLVVCLFVLCLIVAMPFLLKSDDTLSGKVKMAVTYSVYLSMFLLSVMTLFLSTTVISKEVEGRQIFVLDTKPVGRWQVFLGKWVGVMLVNYVLLLVLQLACLGVMMFQLAGGSPAGLQDLDELQNRFLVARGVVEPTLDYDVQEVAAQVAEEWKEDKRLPEDRNWKWVLEHMVPIVQRQRNSVRGLGVKTWRFEGLPADLPDQYPLQLRFRHFVTNRPEDAKVLGAWFFGGYEQPFQQLDATVDVYNEFNVPAGFIDDEGVLEVTYYNAEAGAPTVIFPYDEGLQVFYPEASMLQNFARAFGVIFVMLGFLSLVGLATGACLSYPVAILGAVVFFMVGISAGFLGEHIEEAYFFGPDSRQPGAEFHPADKAAQGTLTFLLFIFPRLMRYSPVKYLADAAIVPDELVRDAWLKLLLLRGSIIALIGIFLFHRRELGTAATQ